MENYDEQIKSLRWCADNTLCVDLSTGEQCPRFKYRETCKQAQQMHESADAIEELISRVPKWISVNEKLPDSQRPVLVYVPESEGFCEYVGMADYTWSPKGGFWCGTDGETYGAIGFIRTPTHWCELPDPPKGE